MTTLGCVSDAGMQWLVSLVIWEDEEQNVKHRWVRLCFSPLSHNCCSLSQPPWSAYCWKLGLNLKYSSKWGKLNVQLCHLQLCMIGRRSLVSGRLFKRMSEKFVNTVKLWMHPASQCSNEESAFQTWWFSFFFPGSAVFLTVCLAVSALCCLGLMWSGETVVFLLLYSQFSLLFPEHHWQTCPFC